MKKLSWLLVLTMLISMFAMTASAEGEYAQAPMFDAAVEADELPPVEEHLPENSCVVKKMLDEDLEMEIDNYGGTLRLTTIIGIRRESFQHDPADIKHDIWQYRYID